MKYKLVEADTVGSKEWSSILIHYSDGSKKKQVRTVIFLLRIEPSSSQIRVRNFAMVLK
jgi:hypothetical protein